MSIDARVETVVLNENGSGRLKLVDRPATRPGENPGIAGQTSLHFDKAPAEVTALNGLNVWGGSDVLMLGERQIARREGYGGIEFVGDEEFRRAVREYHEHAKRAG